MAMMEKTQPEAYSDGQQEPRLTDDEARLADLYSALNFARRLDHAKAYRNVHRQASQKVLIRMTLRVLSIAAVLSFFVALWWWVETHRHDTTPQLQQSQLPTPERADKAMLVLSDGSLVTLDTLSNLQLSDAGLATISSRQGSMLAYEAANNETSAQQKTNKIMVPSGGRFQLRLSDGTKVWLNAATSLEYPVVFGKGERVVSLMGEAFFEVANDPSRPFIVSTPGSSVQVLGTSFNVSVYHDDDFMETTLVSGALRVVSPNGQTSMLAPGQQHRLNQKTLEQTVSQVDTKFFTSWREGVIYFNKVSLRELSVKLERWYDVRITFENEKAGRLIFSGAVENSRKLDFILKLIAEASGIEYSINGKLVVIK